MKIGLAVSTYANENTNLERFNIIKKCLDSLDNIDIHIIIINDASIVKEHINLINKYKDKYHIINREINGGIAKCKNTALKYFEENDFDYCFLMDDDVEILDKNFYQYYINASEKTNIDHLCFQCHSRHKVNIKNINGIEIKESNHTNGCFLMITKRMIKEIGYFKILPFKYEHEHSNYTTRAIVFGLAPGYVDIIGSEKMLKLIDESTEFDSGTRISGDDFAANEIAAFENIHANKYITCVE